MLNILIHASGTACFGYALYYDLVHVHLPPHMATSATFAAMKAFPGKWKYLTIWDIVLQLVYHSVSLLNDLGGTSETSVKRQSALQKLRDGLFASWAFPVGLFVGVSFWVMFLMDRELVFPVLLDTFFPLWLNHALHSAPALFVLAETVLVPRTYPSLYVGVPILLGGVCIYLSWITWVYSQNGVWAYPILEILSNSQRGVFFGACCCSIVGFYFLGEKVCKWRWGSSEETKGTSGSKAKNVGKGKKKTKLT